MKKILYLDCTMGAAGDMLVGALMGLGVKIEELEKELFKLPINNYKLELESVDKKGINALKFNVITSEKPTTHVSFSSINNLILQSSLDQRVKEVSLEIFSKLAETEAYVHGVALEDVCFHEVGAVDSIIDIVGFSILLHKLEVEEIYCSNINVGGGFVDCEHGTLPVPAPATFELLKDIPIYSTNIKEELTTPTAAAILSTVVKKFGNMPTVKITKIGYGAGSKDLPVPNILRAAIGLLLESDTEDKGQWMLECNIDDMNNEFTDYIIDKLFDVGALDVYTTNIQMKKNRSALKLSVLYDINKEDKILEVIFRETTTIGVRVYPIRKIMLERKMEQVKFSEGNVRIKLAFYEDKLVNVAPEYEDCRKIAERTGQSLKMVYQLALNLFWKEKNNWKV